MRSSVSWVIYSRWAFHSPYSSTSRTSSGITVADRYHCACGRRLFWCRYCRLQHCTDCSPHVSRKRKYQGKVAVVRTGSGTKLIGLRKLAQLQGNRKGGEVSATRPNAGRFTSATGSRAARKVWATRWRKIARSGIRIGRRSNIRPAVDHAALRDLYSHNQIRGIWFEPASGGWVASWYGLDLWGVKRRISERTALQRLGHLPRTRKHWQPAITDKITRITTGTIRASKRNRRK